jgi:serine/threonine protein kinase
MGANRVAHFVSPPFATGTYPAWYTAALRAIDSTPGDGLPERDTSESEIRHHTFRLHTHTNAWAARHQLALVNGKGVQMTESATKRVGQVIDGKFRLGEFVGGDEGSSVFLTDYDSADVRKAAIKLVPADSPEAEGLLARWRHAAKLSHPHMIQLLDMGRGELDGAAVLYVVMEYAEENLSSVIARRPLAPAEARAILGPVVDALAYVHAKGFVHCRIKPANIMAENDRLKISSDGLCRIGEFSGSVGKPGAYDPPEAAGGRISPAGDVWSLGMTLCEALTQRLPVWERTNQAEPALPSTLPAEFLDLARHCMRRDPQLRWSVADIGARLLPDAPTPPKQILRGAQSSSARRRFVGTAAPIGLALLAILAAVRVFNHHSRTEPARVVAAAETPKQPEVQPRVNAAVQPKPEKKPALVEAIAPVAKPTPPIASPPASKPVEQPSPKSVVANTAAPTPAPARSKMSTPMQPAATAASSYGIVRGKVVKQFLPDASQKARDTIRGTVRINVKVHVDESGRVTEAGFEAPGPSRYFADRTLEAAKLWLFAPAKMDGHNVPSEWVLRFEIDPAAINVYPAQTEP